MDNSQLGDKSGHSQSLGQIQIVNLPIQDGTSTASGMGQHGSSQEVAGQIHPVPISTHVVTGLASSSSGQWDCEILVLFWKYANIVS